jgi:glycosyltransferase involved in cell wall biosynthesis
MTPYFSIIIPTRNISDLIIKEALPAIKNQSFNKFEVLIIADYLTDNDKKLEDNYDFLKIIKAPSKISPGVKRDLVAKISKGRVLVFIDDDVSPHKDWLKNAKKIFDTNIDLFGVGGPGILPPNANFWEKVFEIVLCSKLGSGPYTYRFTPKKQRFVDDYPTMNLMISKKVFDKFNGFDSPYWPGEDSKMLEKMTKNNKNKILYDPSVMVYHHRRTSLIAYLKQHANYGKTRGLFAAQGDKNSKKISYLLPTIFTLYLAILPILYFNAGKVFILTYQIPLNFYICLLLFTYLKALIQGKHVFHIILAIIIIPTTHIIYGVFFMTGLLEAKLKN